MCCLQDGRCAHGPRNGILSFPQISKDLQSPEVKDPVVSSRFILEEYSTVLGMVHWRRETAEHGPWGPGGVLSTGAARIQRGGLKRRVKGAGFGPGAAPPVTPKRTHEWDKTLASPGKRRWGCS